MEVTTINPGELHDGDTVLDVRHHVGSAQIRGAVRYQPKALLEAEHLSLPLPIEHRIVLHVDRASDALPIADKLGERGAQEVVALKASLDDCRQAGLTLEEPTFEQPVPEVPSAGLPRY
jgi:hypothetical protein